MLKLKTIWSTNIKVCTDIGLYYWLLKNFKQLVFNLNSKKTWFLSILMLIIYLHVHYNRISSIHANSSKTWILKIQLFVLIFHAFCVSIRWSMNKNGQNIKMFSKYKKTKILKFKNTLKCCLLNIKPWICLPTNINRFRVPKEW